MPQTVTTTRKMMGRGGPFDALESPGSVFLILVFDILEHCVKTPRVRVYTYAYSNGTYYCEEFSNGTYYCEELFAGGVELYFFDVVHPGPNGSSLQRRRLHSYGNSTISGRESFGKVGEAAVLLRQGLAWGNDTIACAAVTGPIPRISAWRTACYRLASWAIGGALNWPGGVGEPRSDQVL